MMFGDDNVMDAGNIEGTQWNPAEEKVDKKTAPQIVSNVKEKKPVSPVGTTSIWPSDQQPLVGTIVPLHIAPIKETSPSSFGSFGSPFFLTRTEKKSSNPFKFPMIPAPMQNPFQARMAFHYSGMKETDALLVHNTFTTIKSFPNVSWEPKQPQVFQGKGNEDIHKPEIMQNDRVFAKLETFKVATLWSPWESTKIIARVPVLLFCVCTIVRNIKLHQTCY